MPGVMRALQPYGVACAVVGVMLLIVIVLPMLTRSCANQMIVGAARYASASRGGASTLMRVRDAARAEALLEAARMQYSDAEIRRSARVDVLDFQRYLTKVTGDAMAASKEASENFGRVAWSSAGGSETRKKFHQ